MSDLGASIYLTKNIPIGAGLAGGSSDAASTLVVLNDLWKTNFSVKELEKMSSMLGSDVPFCISGGTQFCFGRGELLEPLSGESESMGILLVKDPLVNVSTPWAYSIYREKNSKNYLKDEKGFDQRRQLLKDASWVNPLSSLNPPPLRNDLQSVVESFVPAVSNSLEFLSNLDGVLSFSMSGSGPSCFAIFPDFESAKIALEENLQELNVLGLQGWCCSFQSKGASLIFLLRIISD